MTLLSKITSRINRSNKSVFLRENFADLGGYDQVGRSLRSLVRSGKLISIGYGIYAKTKVSKLTGKVTLVKPLPELAKEALDRLGLRVISTRAHKEARNGQSSQVPTGRVITVEGRVSRKIGYNGKYIHLQNP